MASPVIDIGGIFKVGASIAVRAEEQNVTIDFDNPVSGDISISGGEDDDSRSFIVSGSPVTICADNRQDGCKVNN